MAEPCPICYNWTWWRRLTRTCYACNGHGRMPYEIDVRGQVFPWSLTQIPDDFDWKYDSIVGNPPDTRSPMIRMLDDPAWRETTKQPDDAGWGTTGMENQGRPS